MEADREVSLAATFDDLADQVVGTGIPRRKSGDGDPFLLLFYSRLLSPLSNRSPPCGDKLAKVLVFYLSAA